MKNKHFLTAVFVAAMLLACRIASAAGDATNELQNLVAKVQMDVHAGQTTEKTLAGDIQQFDALLAEHKGEKTDAVAQILYMKALLYRQVIGDNAKADALMQQLETEFKGTDFVAEIEKMEARQAAAKKIQATLVAGAQFPDFTEPDLQNNTLSVAKYKGKILLIDFWATWCGPCRMEMPNVIAAYQKYHDQGFDIIGVSLDENRAPLENFLKENKMSWPQFFDGQRWDNKLAVKYGIEAIPSNFLLDGNGKIIGKDLRGEELMDAVAKALAGK